MRDVLKLGIILMLYTLVAGAMLAFVHQKTAPIIQANKEAAMSGDVLDQILPGMAGGFEKVGADTDFPYWIGYADAGKTTPGGYIFLTYGKGYSSTIETLVGVDTNMVITGALVMSQQETPGLGDKILQILPGETTPWFTNQFIGTSAEDNLAVTKDNGIIDAISGATISSRAVTNSIAAGIGNMAAVLSGAEVVVEAIPEDEPDPFVLPSDDDLAAVLPGMDGGFTVSGEGTAFPVWTGYRDDAHTDMGGYVVVARGEGFSSTLHTLIATDSDGVITGARTFFQDETPNYGDQVLEVRDGEGSPWFTDQFTGMSADDTIALTDDGGSIDALTGATITSNAVVRSVSEALANLTEALAGETFPAWEYETILSADLATETEEDQAAEPVSATEVLDEVLPGMAGGFVEHADTEPSYWTGYRDSGKTDIGGYVFTAAGEGFASTIETLVGVAADGEIVGITVVAQDETPGYGDRVLETRDGEDSPWFTAQFIGKRPADTIALTEDGGDIDAMTGATVTSRAVAVSVDETIKAVMGGITGETYAAAEPEASDEPDDLMARLMAGADDEEEPPADDEPDDLMAQLMARGATEEEDDEEETMETGPASDDDLASVLTDCDTFAYTADANLPYWTGYRDSGRTDIGGYAFVALGDGFASTIETLVGVDADGNIVGVTVLSQDETPGYGDQILEVRDGEDSPWFTDQFIGKSAGDGIALTDDDGMIDAVTGATVTSKAVTTSIAQGLTELLEQIR